MKVLFTIGALWAGAHAINCDGIEAFQPSDTYAKGSTVIHNGQVYAASVNLAAMKSPRSSAGWIPIGPCAEKLTVRGVSAGEVDCSGVAAWTAKVYSQPNMKVYYEGILYHTKWYAGDTNIPGKEEYGPWEAEGQCMDGTMGAGGADGGAGGPEVDCTSAFPYVAKIYAEPNVRVYYEENMYKTNYYASASDTPGKGGEYGPWSLEGKCKAGTMGEGPVNYVDCTGIPAWSGAITYAEGNKNEVHRDGKLFKNKYWTQGDRPDENNTDGPWLYEGRCESGTDNTPSPPNPNDVTPEKAKLLCTCCQKCASLNNLGPVCLDDVASEDDCYFAWCPSVDSTYDLEVCEHIKDTHQLSYYTGEMPEGQKEWPKHVFVPYIDGGLAEQPPIDELADTLGVKHFVLAFVQTGVYNTTVGCQGGLASVIPIKEGPTSWNSTKQNNDMFYERVANLRKKGGDITISFGGYNGIELADHKYCTEGPNGETLLEAQIVENLKTAYSEAIDFLKLTHIDFDIEGNAYSSGRRNTGWQYRFKAVKALKEKYPYLKVWWTLPILPQGLTQDGYMFVDDLFASGAPIDKINVMTMDYGDSTICPDNDMHACEIMAVDALAEQVLEIATNNNMVAQYGFTSKDSVYPFIGSTPMIGTNDLTHEVYTLQNAKDAMNVWKNSNRKLGIISMWSLTRDHPCSHTYVDCGCTSNNNQNEDYEFSKIFAEWTS